jgi:hypothetical protein
MKYTKELNGHTDRIGSQKGRFQMNKKGVSWVIIAVVIVAVVVVGVVAYWAMTNTGGDNGGNGDGNGGEDVYTVGNATSLQFTISAEAGDSMGTTLYKAKNIGTSDMMVRLDIEMEGMTISYIVNGVEEKAWADEGAGWQDLSDTFQAQYDIWVPVFDAYTDCFADWATGEYTYDDGEGNTVTVSDIAINPTLEDSLFQVSAE